MGTAWIVFCKELLDALRDRRTLFAVLASSAAIGPLVLVLLSWLVSDIEARADSRDVVAHGLEHAPGLRNFIARQTYRVRSAPADFEQRLQSGRLGDAVVVVPPGFEAALSGAEGPMLELWFSSSDQRSHSAAGRVRGLLQGYNQEQTTLRLAMRGVSPAALEAAKIEERDLSDAPSRSARVVAMVPFFVLMAMVYGCMNAALDTTAGELERGSLEPLLLNPVRGWWLVLGKWAAVTSVGLAVAALSAFSFLPGQWLLRSEALAASFRFGAIQATIFVLLLAPLAGALAALLMAVASRCKTAKEAQANATIVVLAVSLLPLITVYGQTSGAAWQAFVPALAQMALLTRIVKEEALPAVDVVISVAVGAAITISAWAYIDAGFRRSASS